jgi:regulator of RNase E activity RraA
VLLAAAAIWLNAPSRIDAATGDPLLDAFMLVESGSVADAVEQLLGKRAHMSSDLQPLFPTKFVGRAVTVQMKKEEHAEGSAAFQGALDAIDSGGLNSVYVMDLGEGGKDIAAIGGIMATAMKAQGFVGAILDGGVRDVAQLRKIQFPVFSSGPVPSTSINHYKFVSANQKIMCGGVEVNAGDIIFTDEDGVVVVPAAEAQKVLEKAQQLDHTEHSMYPFIEKYKSVRKAVEEFGRI